MSNQSLRASQIHFDRKRPDEESFARVQGDESVVWRFAGFELDEACFELRRDGAHVPIQPRAFDVLRLLVRHRPRVVTPGELLRDVWGGASVCDNVIPQAIRLLRRSLGEDAESGNIIRTVRGRGYRFAAAVERCV